jgi:hypothetical protein
MMALFGRGHYMKHRCWPVILLIVPLIAPLPDLAGAAGTPQASAESERAVRVQPGIADGAATPINESRMAESIAHALAASSVSRASRNLNPTLVIDTTSGKRPYIGSAQAAAKPITSRIHSAVPDSRIAR